MYIEQIKQKIALAVYSRIVLKFCEVITVAPPSLTVKNSIC